MSTSLQLTVLEMTNAFNDSAKKKMNVKLRNVACF